jgi:ribosomal-protein-alanine N-acetyltransferase
MTGVASTRLVSLDDVPVLTALAIANRDHLAPWQPTPPPDAFTEQGQADLVRAALDEEASGLSLPHVILDGSGAIVGRIALNSIIRGAFQSASVGYWVDSDATGRGLATAAVASIIELAFGEVGLHRLQGETLPRNLASRRVLERNGFTEFGLASDYLRIDGRWQEHVLYQRISSGWSPR